MTTLIDTRLRPGWSRVVTRDSGVAVAEREALGTTARVALWPPEQLDAALLAVDVQIERLDRQASRFREDSELSRVQRGTPGIFLVSEGLAEAIGVALWAARWTDGLVDPTVGAALLALGYDRDFAAIEPLGARAPLSPAEVPGPAGVRLEGRLLHLGAGVRLDLGATAKGLGSDRAAKAAFLGTARAGGVLVSLGGDITVAGEPPRGGWPVLVADDHRDTAGPGTQVVRLAAGAIATSSILCRRWERAGRLLHHIVDPRTGLPAEGPWRTASVAAASCAEANAASTAAIVAGIGAEEWLATTALPARLVGHDGGVRLLGGWPEEDGGQIRLGACAADGVSAGDSAGAR